MDRLGCRTGRRNGRRVADTPQSGGVIVAGGGQGVPRMEEVASIQSVGPLLFPSVSVSVSVHPGTTSLPMCQSSLYPHDSEPMDDHARIGTDHETGPTPTLGDCDRGNDG